MYHRVCPRKDSWSLAPIIPEEFEKQIKYLSRNFEIIPLAGLSQLIRQRKNLPAKAVVITFDDGYRDNYIYAYLILKQYRVPATIFLTTGHISSDKLFWWDKVGFVIHHTNESHLNLNVLGDYSLQVQKQVLVSSQIIERLKRISEENKNRIIDKLVEDAKVNIPSGLARDLILSWDEIKEMCENGIDFGAHTVNHPILANMPLQQAKWEIIQSKKDIEKELGKEINIFSYPNGSFRDFNTDIMDFIKTSEFSCSVSFSSKKLISLNDNILALNRISGGENFDIVKAELSGFWGDAESILTKGTVKGKTKGY